MADSLRELRAHLAAEFKSALGKGWVIFPGPTTTDEITKPTLVLVRDRVTPLPSAPASHFDNALTLWVIFPATTSEDVIDDHLESVLQTIDGHDWLFTEAARDVWTASEPAYRIALSAPSERKK